MSANAGGRRDIASTAGGNDVMAAVDRSGEEATFVVADLSVDDAWLTTPVDDALDLPTWR